MSDSLQAVLDKVRKLRALSKSANANEAAAAARAADKLIQQYRIDEAQIAQGDVERDLYPIESFGTRTEISWQLVLHITPRELRLVDPILLDQLVRGARRGGGLVGVGRLGQGAELADLVEDALQGVAHLRRSLSAS